MLKTAQGVERERGATPAQTLARLRLFATPEVDVPVLDGPGVAALA